ncbi:MAG: response regulator [Curvibacter sp.]|nr:response regulator [Curvibacter sp.]
MSTQNTVLIADDDPRNRKLLTTLLLNAGYRVVSVASGAAALEAVASQSPALLLLDLMMPGMDGFEVVHRLKSDPATAAMPVIMVTAIDDEGSRARLAAAGVKDLLIKPVDRWALKAMLDRVLGGGHGQD